MKNISLILGLFLVVFSCVPPSDNLQINFNVDYKDPEIQKINSLFIGGNKDSLLFYLESDIPKYRFYALQFFNAEQDSSYIDFIMPLLKNQYAEVRTQAAISLGNIGHHKVVDDLIASFINEDSIDVNNPFNRAILEAVGKTATIQELVQISTVTRYRPKDHHLILGQISAIYQFGLRGIFSDESTDKAVSFIVDSSYPDNVRTIAAHYLARFNSINLADNVNLFIEQFNKERNPIIRASLASIISRYPNAVSEEFIKNSLLIENDYRVISNIMRGLKNFNYRFASYIAFDFIAHSNPHISILASEYFLNNGNNEDYYKYYQVANDSLYWEVNSNMLSSALKYAPLYYTRFKQEVTNRMKEKSIRSKNIYEKRALVLGMCEDPFNLESILNSIDVEKDGLVKLAMIDGIAKILDNPISQKAFGYRLTEQKTKVIRKFVDEFQKNDPRTMRSISIFFTRHGEDFKEVVTDYNFFKIGLNSLAVPNDNSTYDEVIKVIRLYEPDFADVRNNGYFKSISWDLLREISDSFNIEVKTTKGNFKLELYPEIAISSVLNFIELINQDYYDGMDFHRVVSNFVVQAGCPRGDGLGSKEYTIRTESNNNSFHEEGLVGMASSGLNTESCQFFITTNAAPHLDGRYTMFGKVISGMEIVHALQKGDKIIDMILVKFIK